VKTIIVIFLLIPLLLSANSGHRLGKNVIKKYPENTVEILREALDKDVHKKKSFRYWEFDIRETQDERMVVYHNKKIKEIYIFKTEYDILREIRLKDCCQLPTPEEVLEVLNGRYKGKVAAEIKHLYSHNVKRNLIQLVDHYNSKGNLRIVMIMTLKHFKKSFSEEDRKFYCPLYKRIAQVRKHKVNLCKKYL